MLTDESILRPDHADGEVYKPAENNAIAVVELHLLKILPVILHEAADSAHEVLI